MKRGSSELKRTGGPAREPIKRSQPKRNWTDARAKIDAEKGCRLAHPHDPDLFCLGAVEAAHVIGRENDAKDLTGRPHGLRVWKVDPGRVIPLCSAHHRAYDRHELDILSVLTVAEQAQAVIDAGGVELMRRRTAPLAYKPN